MSDMPAAGIDRPERSGSPGLVLVLAILLVAVVVAFAVLPRDEAQRLILAFLALLAVVGVFALFALAVGFIQFAGAGSRNDLTKLLADTSTEGLLVTEGEAQPIYANDAYMALSGARSAAELRLVDRLFAGTADVSEAVYRLALAAREGKTRSEELRLSPPLLGDVRTESIDVDLKRRNGQSLPVRLLHRVAFGQDATPGISRTLVLNRASGEEPAEDLRAAEVRFARLFNSTPMAIAALDRSGHIVRSNAAFAKLIPQALKGGESGRSIYAAVAERDRP